MRNQLEFAVAGQEVELVRPKRGNCAWLKEVEVETVAIDRTTKAQVVVKLGNVDVYFRKADGQPGNKSSWLARGWFVRAK